MPATELKRGQIGWKFNKFRELLLPALLADLQEKEEAGLINAHCDRVQRALRDSLNEAVRVTPLFPNDESLEYQLRGFCDLYFQWNSTPADTIDYGRSHRRKHLEKLRRQRDEIAKITKENMHVLVERAEEKAAGMINESLCSLANELPQLFPRLSNAAWKYAKRNSR